MLVEYGEKESLGIKHQEGEIWVGQDRYGKIKITINSSNSNGKGHIGPNLDLFMMMIIKYSLSY